MSTYTILFTLISHKNTQVEPPKKFEIKDASVEAVPSAHAQLHPREIFFFLNPGA